MESKRIMPVSHFDLVELVKGDPISASVPIQKARDGFALYMRGRLAEDIPLYAQRIDAHCGMANHLAAVSALDRCYQVILPQKALRIRHALAYLGVFFAHLQQLFFSRPSGSDGISSLVMTDEAEAGDVFGALSGAGEAIGILGGRGITPERLVPGGLTRGITDKELARAKDIAANLLDFSLRIEEEFRTCYAAWVKEQGVLTQAYSLATVDDSGACSFYQGTLRIVDPKGTEFAKGDAKKILAKVAAWKEKLPLRVGPLARINVGCQASTPEARRSQEKLFEVVGQPPVHLAAVGHWATVIELVQAAELLSQELEQLETGNSDIHCSLNEPGEGIAAIEGACGTAIHRYVLDKQGMVAQAQIAPTGELLASEVKAAISAVVNSSGHEVTEATAERIANVISAYQPAFEPKAEFSLLITMRDKEGKMIEHWRVP
jgi:F420-non-reducing hydrogenase large subunit